MIVVKIHEIISIEQSKWLKKYINFITQKRNEVKNDFENDFFKLLINTFYGKTIENVRNRSRLEYFKKNDVKNIIKQQSKLTSNGIHESNENHDSYVFKKMKF